jgi:hypothetical protein
MLHFVENTDQVIENIRIIEQYLHSDNAAEKQFAQDLVKKGRSMVIYKVNGENHFAPIRFLGYKKNNMIAHIDNENKVSRDTAPAIQSLMGKPFTHLAIEKEFMDYADKFKGSTLKSKRKYWRIRNDQNKYFELEALAEAAVV